MNALHALLLMVFPACVIAAALRDATTFTIPNWLSAGAALAFFPTALAAGLPLSSFAVAAGIGFAGLALGVGMFGLGWIGGGDAKLFAACALWLGWPALIPFLTWTALAGGGLAVALLCARKASVFLGARGPAWVNRLLTPGENVPYGVAIAAGALAAFPQGVLLHVSALH